MDYYIDSEGDSKIVCKPGCQEQVKDLLLDYYDVNTLDVWDDGSIFLDPCGESLENPFDEPDFIKKLSPLVDSIDVDFIDDEGERISYHGDPSKNTDLSMYPVDFFEEMARHNLNVAGFKADQIENILDLVKTKRFLKPEEVRKAENKAVRPKGKYSFTVETYEETYNVSETDANSPEEALKKFDAGKINETWNRDTADWSYTDHVLCMNDGSEKNRYFLFEEGDDGLELGAECDQEGNVLKKPETKKQAKPKSKGRS